MKYYLIIIAFSVWQEIEFLLKNNNYHDADAVEEKINTLARNSGIDYDFTCNVKEYSFTNLFQNDEREMIPADAKSGRKR